MSLNDSTVEGDFYNTHSKKSHNIDKTYHDFDIFANQIAKDLFSKKPPLYRRIYESIRNTIRSTTRFVNRRKR